jgi:hypothetical protein
MPTRCLHPPRWAACRRGSSQLPAAAPSVLPSPRASPPSGPSYSPPRQPALRRTAPSLALAGVRPHRPRGARRGAQMRARPAAVSMRLQQCPDSRLCGSYSALSIVLATLAHFMGQRAPRPDPRTGPKISPRIRNSPLPKPSLPPPSENLRPPRTHRSVDGLALFLSCHSQNPTQDWVQVKPSRLHTLSRFSRHQRRGLKLR